MLHRHVMASHEHCILVNRLEGICCHFLDCWVLLLSPTVQQLARPTVIIIAFAAHRRGLKVCNDPDESKQEYLHYNINQSIHSFNVSLHIIKHTLLHVSNTTSCRTMLTMTSVIEKNCQPPSQARYTAPWFSCASDSAAQ